jgi:hypothetical protein
MAHNLSIKLSTSRYPKSIQDPTVNSTSKSCNKPCLFTLEINTAGMFRSMPKYRNAECIQHVFYTKIKFKVKPICMRCSSKILQTFYTQDQSQSTAVQISTHPDLSLNRLAMSVIYYTSNNAPLLNAALLVMLRPASFLLQLLAEL